MPKDDVYIKLTTETKKSVASIAKYTVAVTAAYMAVKKGLAVMKDLEQAYFAQERAETKLRNALKATKNAVGISFGEMKKYAAQMQKTTGIGDELIIGAQGLMTTFTQIGKDVFPTAIKAAADMSIMFGQELQQSVIQLGTALNDPIAGVGRLKRIGVSFTEDQQKSIKAFMDQNDIMSAQAVILDELKVEFGGVAEAMGETLEGGVKKLTASLSDLKEEMGRIVAEGTSGFKRFLTEIINGMIEATKQSRLLSESWKDFAFSAAAPAATRLEQIETRIEQVTAKIKALKQTPSEGAGMTIGEAIIAGLGGVPAPKTTANQALLFAEAEMAGLMRGAAELRLEMARFAGEQEEDIRLLKAAAVAAEKYAKEMKQLADAFFTTPTGRQEALFDLIKDFGEYDFSEETEGAKQLAIVLEFLVGEYDRLYVAQSSIKPLPKSRGKHGLRTTKGTDTDTDPLSKAGRLADLGLAKEFALEAKDDPTQKWQEAEATRVEELTDLYIEYGKAIGEVFGDIGADLVRGEDLWASLAKAAVTGIAAIVDAIGQELLVVAAKNAVLALGGDLTKIPAAVAAGAGAATAFATAGGIRAIPMAEGGIVNKPTLALLGENGPERVQPLGASGGGGGVSVVNHFHGTVRADDNLAAFVAGTVARMRRPY